MIRTNVIVLLVISLLSVNSAYECRASEGLLAAAEGDGGEVFPLVDTIVVTATRTRRSTFKVPKSVTVLGRKELKRMNKLSVLDGLRDHVGVWVEKRTSTTSDPVMRGMSGFNILALIDGNTLSTHWGEGGVGGDDMYGKVDADQVERIEVVRGPSSVLYGSNALGGVINFHTVSSPFDYTTSGSRLGAKTKLVYGSAASEFRNRTEVYGATRKLRFILGGSYRDVKDVRAGRGIGLQTPTGGRDLNWDLKLHFRPWLMHEFELSVIDVARDDVKRFYRPTQTNYNDRIGISTKYRGTGIFDDADRLDITLYHQYKKDTRLELVKKETYWTRTKTYTADIQWSDDIGSRHALTTGVHYQLDDGESPDDEQFTRQTATGIAKDAPDSDWSNIAFYVQDEWELSNRMVATIGGRWDNFNFKTRIDSFYTPPGGVDPQVDQVDQQENTLTGGLGLVYHANEVANIFINIGRGFRQYAPVFGIKEHGYGIQVPSELLNPASSINYELGFKARGERVSGTAALYYTSLKDFPVVVPTTYLGQDWYDYDGSGTRETGEATFVTANTAEAYVWGVETEATFRIGAGWLAKGGLAYSYGRDKTRDEPLRHTIPVWTNFKLQWLEPSAGRWWLELTCEGASAFDRIPPGRITTDPGYRIDPQDMSSPIIGPNGRVPGWVILTARGEYVVNSRITLNVVLENLTDKAYRRVHSRFDEVGMNLVLGITLGI